MRLTHKQKQLVDELFNKVKERYPEIVFKDLQTNPDDPEHIRINVIADMHEDKEFEMRLFAANIEIDILLNYGYAISVMPENANAVYA